MIAGSTSSTRRVISPRAAFWVTDILSDDEARSYVFGRGGSLEFPFPVAVKTGTSQAYRDNWTVGYTREVTVGVWVGNFDRRPLIGSSGVTGAAPIFHAVMLAAQRHVHGREEPDADLVGQAGRPAGTHHLRALGDACRRGVPDSHARMASSGLLAASVLVASRVRRRPADDVAGRIPHVGRRPGTARA